MIAAFIYSFLCFLTFGAVEEDAFIYFKFAANLADGYGYVFNRGGERIESGSSPLWLLILSSLYLLPLHIISITKLVGYLSGLLCLLLIWGVCYNLSIKRIYAFISLLLTASTANFVLCSHWGLESPLYVASILLLVWLCTHRTLSDYWCFGAVTVVFCRPEGFFILFALIPFILLSKKSLSNILYSTLIISIFFSLFTFLRLYYFEDFLPHPFYLKMGFNFHGKLEHTLLFLNSPYFYLLSIPVGLALIRPKFWDINTATIVVIGLFVGYWSVIASDQKLYFRHLLPALVLFYILVAKSLSLIPQAHKPVTERIFLLIILLGITINNSYSNLDPGRTKSNPLPIKTAMSAFVNEPKAFILGMQEKFRHPMTRNFIDQVGLEKKGFKGNYQSLVGEFINHNYPKGITIIYDQMGQTPFYSGLDKNFIDSLGLTYKATGYHHFLLRADQNKVLSLYKGLFVETKSKLSPEKLLLSEQQGVLDHLFDIESEIIMINVNLAKKLPNSIPAALRSDLRLAQHYQKTYVLAGLVEVYERPGLRNANPIIPKGLHVTEYNQSLAARSGGL